MSIGKDDVVTESAGRIADGRGADWDSDLRDTPGHDGERAALGRVAQIADAWRALGVTPDDDAPAEAPVFRWGELEAREKIGEGSFGEVWRAWDPATQREVALKLRRAGAPDASSSAGLAEARRLARVRHPNVLTLYGVDVRDGRAGLWTDLIHGVTLEQLLRTNGRLGAAEATAIGLDLCRALAAVHAAGLAHGDLKAGNVMREDGGRIVLMDFGSTHELANAPEGGGGTGTPLAAAPETLEGAPASPASDVYSLGALLYRLVTGTHPIEATTLAELRERHARGERVPLRTARPDLPTAFVAAIERALESDPAKRWADAGAFERALASGDAVALAPSRGAAMPWAPALAAGFVVLALGAIALYGLRPKPEPARGGAQSPAPTALGAPATAPSASAATPATPLAVEATLWRQRGDARDPLAEGSAVSPGDHLSLEYRGHEPLHLYVLDEDEHGQTYTLFPVAGTDLSNPLASGTRLRLPGRHAGQPFDWVVTSTGGREHVLLVASRRPLAELDQLVAATAPADTARGIVYAELNEGAIASLRGIGGMGPAPKGPVRESRLAAIAAGIAARAPEGVWARHMTLENR